MKKLFLFTILLITTRTFSQEMPEAQKNLKQFMGKWNCKETTFAADGKSSKVDYTVEFGPVCAGTGLHMHEWFSSKELGDYLGENIVGFDPNTGLIHWYSIDNAGTCHDHAGYWITPKHLFIEHQGVQENKILVEQIDFEFISGTELKAKLIGMLNGKETMRIEGTFKKVN